MCGIIGIATACKNGFTVKEADAFLEMLYYDALRGVDSTGVFGVDKHANVEIHKEASHAANFLSHKVVSEFKGKLISNGLFAVGHNRAATRGAVEDKNAHPFHVDDKIVLVQNGTWRGDHKKIKDTEVDTEVIAHLLSEEEDVEKALSKVQAAYALSWMNTETKTLHLVRNYERPLWLASTKSGTLLWASEPGFIQLACLRNDITLEGKPVELEPHNLVSLKIDGNGWVREDKKVNPFRHYQNTATLGDDEDNDVLGWYGGYGYRPPKHFIPPQQQVTRHPCVPSDPEKVDKPFAEVAFSTIKECHLDDRQLASEIQSDVLSTMTANPEKRHLIELEDFLPANTHKMCTTWHVWGNLVTADNRLAKNAIVHWFVYNKTNDEMVNYVTEGFYEATLVHCRLHTMNDKTHIVSVMCNKPELIKTDAVH